MKVSSICCSILELVVDGEELEGDLKRGFSRRQRSEQYFWGVFDGDMDVVWAGFMLPA